MVVVSAVCLRPLISRILSPTISTVMLSLVCSQGMLLVLFPDLPLFFLFHLCSQQYMEAEEDQDREDSCGGVGGVGGRSGGGGWRDGRSGGGGGDLSMRRG